MKNLSCARATIDRVDALIASLENPLHREMLGAFRLHWWSEVLGDLDAAMSAMTPQVVFKSTGSVPSGGPFEVHTSAEQRAIYEIQVAAGLSPAGGYFDNERWAFADWGMMLEAQWVFALYGNMISNYGDYDPEQLYLVKVPAATVMPYGGGGRLSGESLYMGDPLEIEPTDWETYQNILRVEI